MSPAPVIHPKVTFQIAQDLSPSDMTDLCVAAEDAIQRGGGFGWLKTPGRETMEAYWRGLTLVRGRHLFLARLDGVISGALQLHEAPKNMESQSSIGKVQTGFTASWARGHGIGTGLMQFAIDAARAMDLSALKLDVRATHTSAMRIYRGLGFKEWGVMPRYVQVDGQWVDGHYFFMDL